MSELDQCLHAIFCQSCSSSSTINFYVLMGMVTLLEEDTSISFNCSIPTYIYTPNHFNKLPKIENAFDHNSI